jgi:hypothetical protein
MIAFIVCLAFAGIVYLAVTVHLDAWMFGGLPELSELTRKEWMIALAIRLIGAMAAIAAYMGLYYLITTTSKHVL